MTAVFITVYRQRTQPKIYEERSVQGQINQIIYIDIDCEYHLQLSTAFNLTVNKPIILTHARRRD